MNFNDLLKINNIEPQNVLIFRHRPMEDELNKVLPWIAAERPDVFNAYQQTQGAKLEKVLQSFVGTGYVASFIRRQQGKALFIGLYAIGKSKPMTYEQFWKVPAYAEMKKWGITGFTREAAKSRPHVLWFDLTLQAFYSHWKGKLVIDWPPPERSWWRRAHRNDMEITAILEESALDAEMPQWDAMNFTWDELAVLPTRWKLAMSQWRGIYYIFDTTANMGYVGSAYGKDNILGRWNDYAARGHGGNHLLRNRDPRTFRFSILQRVSPDMDAESVIQLECSWKERLHTRHPHGLNEN